MSTPAYFFIGVGGKARNIGRRQYDGSPDEMLPSLSRAHSVSAFTRAAKKLSDETFEEVGPTQWKDANYNYVYALDNGRIRVFSGNDYSGKQEISATTSGRGRRGRVGRGRSAPPTDVAATILDTPQTTPEWTTVDTVLAGVAVALGVFVLYKLASPAPPQ